MAAKVLHLGDQLDSVNGPRSRVVDAQRLMTHLNEFLSNEPLQSSIFSDPFRVCFFFLKQTISSKTILKLSTNQKTVCGNFKICFSK